MSTLIESENLYQKLQKQYSRKINLDLKRINLALKKLGGIHKSIRNPINIIGSDGKYSTLRALQYFIEENKQKVSTFTSPHLYDVRQRFWLKDRYISIKELKKNIKLIEKLKTKLTLFELLTLVYIVSAAKLNKTSYSLVEAGLLFSKDSTRIWEKPKLQIVTNVNEQHLEWVKPKNLKSICEQKVGYLSKKTTIYVGRQNKLTFKIIKKILKKNPSKKKFYGIDWTLKKIGKKRIFKDSKGKLLVKSKKILSEGIWDNVGLAIKVARDLNISDKNILKAITKISFEGSFHYINKGKWKKLLYPRERLMIDGSHSQAGAKNLAFYLKNLKSKEIYGIWGMQKHKQPELYLKYFRGIFKKIIAIKIPDEPNTCHPQKLKKIANQNGIKCEIASDIKSSIKKISNKKTKTIISFGSLYLAGKFYC